MSSSLDYTRPVLSARYLNRGTREEMGLQSQRTTHSNTGGRFTKSSAPKSTLPSKEGPRVDADPPLTSDRIPLDIPGDTEVPLWAYLNVTVRTILIKVLVPSPKTEQEEDNFNLTAARALAGMCRGEHVHCILFD